MADELAMKDRVASYSPRTEGHNLNIFHDITAPCDLCGEKNVGVGTPVLMMVPGMIFPSREFDVPMVVPDPDVKMQIVKLPNGQIGFVTDETMTKYAHGECYSDLVDQAMYAEDEDDEEEDY